MGTSKGQMPPSNGDWSPLKSDITNLVKYVRNKKFGGIQNEKRFKSNDGVRGQ